MIPRTFPSTFAFNGQQQMVVYFLTSVEGLQRWADYIPVKLTQGGSENTYNNDGYINVTVVGRSETDIPFKDYVPVFVDSAATDVWQVNSTGFIPYNYAGFGNASLVLDFTSGNQTLDPRITFTRSTTATRTNSSGLIESVAIDAPRFNYNPTTFESLGLLIEESGTNLLTYSEQFDDAAWTKNNSSIAANTIVAPDGALTGDKLVENSATANHFIAQNASVTSGTAYTVSFYAKKSERTQCALLFAAAGFGTQTIDIFDLDTGTVVTNASGTAAITAVNNGWYKVSTTRTATVTVSPSFQIRTANGGITNYLGDGFSGIYIWGAQLEAGAFATSYIPTVASQVTRAADSAVMTGTNFTSWYNAAEGTLFSEASTYDVSEPRVGFSLSDGTVPNRIQIGHGAGARLFIANNGVTQMSQALPSVTFSNNTASKVSLAYELNNGNGAANSTIGTLDTAMTIPTVTQARIGGLTATLIPLNGHVRRIAYYPRRLSDVELQGITS